MNNDTQNLSERRRNVLRAILELDEGIASVRRSLERARRSDPNSPDINDPEPEREDGPATDQATTTESP